MRPRIIIIIVAVIIVAAIMGAVVLKFWGGTNMGTNGLSGADLGIASTSSVPSAPLPVSQIYPSAPTGAQLPIGTPSGTVMVNNFYPSAAGVIEGGQVLIKETPTYWITYDPRYGSFWIGVDGTPFGEVRSVAEQDFLTTLGISKADACKLAAVIGVPYAPGNPMSGQSFRLSFCSGTL